jgi:glutamate formiminotransferase / 5-formyltetrahydrofolate cyclo-ligase
VLPLESVPNVSEGREPEVVEAIARAFGGAGARVVDVHMDADHNRSVITLLGDERELEDGLVAGIAEAGRRIDLQRHAGVHPRVGAADVVPLVPLSGADHARAVSVAGAVAHRVGVELSLPVFLYGAVGDDRRPSFYRRGGPAELEQRLAAGELRPSDGPPRIDPRSGAVLVGVRPLLVAYNVGLAAPLQVARQVAEAVRESSGGLRGVQALGLALRDDVVQVSTNLVDIEATALHVLVARIVAESEARGAQPGAGELVGLVPRDCIVAAAEADGGVEEVLDDDALPTRAALAAAARALRLERLDADRVLEWHLSSSDRTA